MSFKAYYLTPEGVLRRELTEQQVRAAFESKEGLLWVDVAETTEEDGELMERILSLHHLAVEDCLSAAVHPPKIDDFGDYLFIIVHGINHTAESDIVETTELSLFLGPHFVISNHRVPLHSVDSIDKLVEQDGRPLTRGPDFLAHALIDALVDNVLPTVDRMSSHSVLIFLRRLGKQGEVEKVKVHRFRHTFATWAIENEARELDVQYLLGHSTPAMVRRYSATYDAEKAARAHERFSPADRMGERLR